MEFKSGLLDTLKLLLKDKYILSDKDYLSLSDIILKLNLVDVTEKGILTSLIFFMDKNNLKFPISYNFMKDLWEKSNSTVNFGSMLSQLVLDKLLSLRKLTPDTFFNSPNIDRHDIDKPGQEYYLVVFGTNLYNTLIKNISDANLLKEKIENMGYLKLTEGVNFGKLDSKYKKFVLNTINLIRTKMFSEAKIESFDYDSLKNEIDFNFIINIPKTRKSNVKDKDLRRVFKKWVKGDFVIETDSYIDDGDNIFFTVKLDMRILSSSFKSISDNIVYAVNELIDLAQGGAA